MRYALTDLIGMHGRKLKVINYLNDESGTYFDPDILEIFLDYIMGNIERKKETE